MPTGRIRAVVKRGLRAWRYAAASSPPAKACVDMSRRRAPHSIRRFLVLGDREHFEGGSVLAKMMRLGNMAATYTRTPDQVFAIKWAPWSEYDIPDSIRASLTGIRVINDTNFSCRKSWVSRRFEEVFGYPILVDPRHFEGWCVMKSERNAAHDGRLVRCPIVDGVPDGTTCQIVIDNRVGGKFVEDIRVPIIGSRIPFVYLKYRPLEIRFSNDNAYARMASQHELFSPSEIRLIREYVGRIGLEYGEIDVLRDGPSGRIYVVDANNTPYGPPNHLESGEVDTAIRILADAFVEEFAR